MLSIRTLAARLSVNDDWLLNNAELSRVHWKPGSRAGELIVEVEAAEEDHEMKGADLSWSINKHEYTHTTTVGHYDDMILPGANYAPPPPPPKPAPRMRRESRTRR